MQIAAALPQLIPAAGPASMPSNAVPAQKAGGSKSPISFDSVLQLYKQNGDGGATPEVPAPLKAPRERSNETFALLGRVILPKAGREETKAEPAKRTSNTAQNEQPAASVTGSLSGAGPNSPQPQDSPAPTQAHPTTEPPAAIPARQTLAPKPPPDGAGLAFAMRIDAGTARPEKAPAPANGFEATSDAEPAAQANPSRALAAAAGNPRQQHEGDTTKQDNQAFACPEQPKIEARPSGAAPHSSSSASAATFDVEMKHATEAVRGARVQVIGADNQRVDIRLMEKGSGMAISVTSTDATLTRALQDHVPDLAARLESQHYHTETWTPAASGGSASGGKGDDSQWGGSRSFGGGGQQRQGEGDKPKWVQELENSNNSSTTKEIFNVGGQQF